jgi:hypothetical protein
MELLSTKDFADRIEISSTMVNKYIDKGKIGEDAIHVNKKNGRKQIDFIVGLQYYAIYNDISNLQYIIDNPDVLTQLDIPGQPKPPEDKGTKPVKEKKEKKVSSEQLQILESERREKSAKAQLAELNLNKALGLLVNFDEVKKVLHSFGAEIRLALEAIPDREIDNIFSANDRGEAHLILTLAIKNALTALTKIEDKVVVKPSSKK